MMIADLPPGQQARDSHHCEAIGALERLTTECHFWRCWDRQFPSVRHPFRGRRRGVRQSFLDIRVRIYLPKGSHSRLCVFSDCGCWHTTHNTFWAYLHNRIFGFIILFILTRLRDFFWRQIYVKTQSELVMMFFKIFKLLPSSAISACQSLE